MWSPSALPWCGVTAKRRAQTVLALSYWHLPLDRSVAPGDRATYLFRASLNSTRPAYTSHVLWTGASG